MRYLWFSAFAICGIAFYLWLETWAQAHRQAHERLLEELATDRDFRIEEDTEANLVCIDASTSWPDSITVPNDNGTSITAT